MNRRRFFAALAGAAAASYDPERLLWVPGRKLISIPKPAPMLWTKPPFVFVAYPPHFHRHAFVLEWPRLTR